MMRSMSAYEGSSASRTVTTCSSATLKPARSSRRSISSARLSTGSPMRAQLGVTMPASTATIFSANSPS